MTVLGALHLTVFAHAAWGRIRPLCILVARLVRIHPQTHVTFFTPVHLRNKVVTEIARNFEDGEGHLESLIRVVGLHCSEQFPPDIIELEHSFEQQCQALAKGEPIFCAAEQKQVPALQRPDAFIVDAFCSGFMQISRRLSPRTKIWGSVPEGLSSAFTLFGPFAADSQGHLQGLAEQHMIATGLSFIEAAHSVIGPTSKVIQGPGLLPMFKHENFPQERPVKAPFIGLFHLSAASVIHECDTLITQTTAVYEPPEAVGAFEEFFSLTSRKMRLLGPLVPDTRRSSKIELEQGGKSPEIVAFLDSALQKYGENSLVYIAFGTIFWCMQPDRLWTILDVLLERKTPFILSHASPFSHIPADISEKIQASGMGILTPWAPQQTILTHPATGWFLTHGGFNSIMESIDAGVPLICWPFMADQPLNTLHLTENLNVAYELSEVRTGSEALKPVHRTGKTPTGTLETVRLETIATLGKAFGEDGAKKRANTQKLRDASLGLWQEGGSSRIAAQQLLESLL